MVVVFIVPLLIALMIGIIAGYCESDIGAGFSIGLCTLLLGIILFGFINLIICCGIGGSYDFEDEKPIKAISTEILYDKKENAIRGNEDNYVFETKNGIETIDKDCCRITLNEKAKNPYVVYETYKPIIPNIFIIDMWGEIERYNIVVSDASYVKNTSTFDWRIDK